MKKLILFSLMAVVLLSACNNTPTPPSKYGWIDDKSKVDTIIDGENYLLIVKKDKKDFKSEGMKVIPSSDAVDMLKEYASLTDATLRDKRSFSVTLKTKDVVDYLSLFNADEMRIYMGAYPRDMDANHPKDRFTAFVVAVNNGAENYTDGRSSTEIRNLGNLCPTNCPDGDAGSIYVKAGSPKYVK